MRLRPIIGWAVFCILISIVVSAVPSPTAAYYFFNGKRLKYSRKYDAAIDSYQKAVEANPKFARAYVEIGSLEFSLKKYDAAEAAFKNAMNAEEDSCAACGLGMVYRMQEKYAEAETILRKSIQLNRHDSCPYNQLGRLYYDREEYLKAAEVFEQELKITRSAVSLHFLANSLYFGDRVTESLKYYQQAVHLDRNYEPIYNDFARAYNVSGHHNEALKIYETELRFDADNAVAHAGIGYTQLIMGNPEAAYNQYEELLPLDGKMAGQLLIEIKRRLPSEVSKKK
jgi:tetratricopeptide (TPR) repeat protein